MKQSDYIPPFSDFGFKNLYGKPKSKENLIFLLNQIFKGEEDYEPIVDLEYKNVENQGDNSERKTTRFDVYCKTDSGKIFIVEMQNQLNSHLKQRLIFYLCQAVVEQDSRTESNKPWNYDFPQVKVIMFCNFVDSEIDKEEVNDFGILNRKSHRELGRHVSLTLLQIPLFPKRKEECKTELEKIVYSMEHMETILTDKEISFSKREGDFYDRIQRMSRTGALTQDELHAYHQWLKVTNDDRLLLYEAENRGRAEGLLEGRAEGRAEGIAEGENAQAWKSAQRMHEKGFSLIEIADLTDLPISELEEKFKS